MAGIIDFFLKTKILSSHKKQLSEQISCTNQKSNSFDIICKFIVDLDLKKIFDEDYFPKLLMYRTNY